MATKSLDEESKVMDVSKPGKGKIVATSRPVVASVAHPAPGKVDPNDVMPGEGSAEPAAKAPSEARKVIQPISVMDDNDDKQEVAVGVSGAEPGAGSNQNEPAQAAEQPVKEPTASAKEPNPKPENDNPAEGSDAAGVEALANAAEAKKKAAHEAEEAAKRDAELDELIRSKKYYVRTSRESVRAKGKGLQRLAVLIIVLIAAVAGAYLIADAGLYDPGFELPFDFIK